MPKLRVPAEEQENRAIIASILYGEEMTGTSHEQLALAMHFSIVTLYDRLKHPDEFKLKELRLASKRLHIPLSKLVLGE